jgi:DeoR family transcriptional regulator, catabolite repression regulator
LRPDLAILTMAGILEARPRVGYFYSGKSTNTIIAVKLNKIKVGDIMSVPVVVHEDTTVYDAVVTMFIEDVGSLFVVKEGGVLEGVISRKDLLKIAMGGIDVNKMPVGVVMTRMPNIVTTNPDEPVVKAGEKMILREVDGLPVIKLEVNEKGEDRPIIIGRLTKTNLTRLFVELGEGK